MAKLFDDQMFDENNLSAFFPLIKSGIETDNLDGSGFNELSEKEWDNLFKLSNKHEVAALVSDALLRNAGLSVPVEIKLKFVGMQEITEKTYERQLTIIDELLDFYNAHCIPTMVLKGVTLSQYYPNPSHRKCGDVDIFQFGFQRASDAIISNSFGLEVRQYKVSHHTNFIYKGLNIENHFGFLTTYHGGRAAELEAILEKELHNVTDSWFNGRAVKVPSPTFNALFLICHAADHFRSSRISIRQMIDWLLFLRNEFENIDWPYVQGIYEKFGLSIFVNAINGILIRYFGMPYSFAYKYINNELLEKRIIEDTLMTPQQERIGDEFSGKLRQEWYRYITGGWKYRLFDQNGLYKMIEKLRSFILHPGDYKEMVVLSATGNQDK